MPKIEFKPLTPEAQTLVARVAEVMRAACAQPGQPVTIPADLARAIDDAALAAAMPEILARRRLEWLHSRDSCNVGGWEWGIFRVRWENGQPAEVQHTYGDFSDLDAAMAHGSGVTEAGHPTQSQHPPMSDSPP